MSPTVPFIDLRRLTREVMADMGDDCCTIFNDADFVGGPRVDALEAALAQRLGVPYVVACANGTDALVMGLLALGVKPGDVVALPALTFWATYEAVVLVGARPLLIDCDPGPSGQQMSGESFVEAHDRHHFRFAIFAHLFGWTSGEMGWIRTAARSRGIALLEDAAQAFGVRVERGPEPKRCTCLSGPCDGECGYDRAAWDAWEEGRPLLMDATMATLSFYPAKVIGGCMDGGAVTCASAEHAAALRSLRNHGRPAAGGYLHERVGMNSRMSAINAAYLLRVLAMSDAILNDRRDALLMYYSLLDGKRGLRVHMPPSGVVGNGYLCVVTSERRSGEELAAALQERGIGWARTYPLCLADQEPARGAMVWGDLANARAFCRGVVNLPLFYGITTQEVERSADAILEGA